MSNKEINRVHILEQLKRKEISQKTTSLVLGLSTRQVRRIFKNYCQKGISGLIHQGRGKVSNRKIDQIEIDKAINLVKQKYPDFGPTFALEKLIKHHKITFGVDTLRLAMIKADIWKPHRKRVVLIHQLRERRDCEGELIQLDGSPYRWLEDRGDIGICTLLVAIDDATSKLEHLLLVKSESIESYFEFMNGYLRSQGKPIAWYIDKHSVFRISSKQGEITCEDSQGLTQFGRAMKELSIGMIFANSPQAKGRVERSNKTLQNRLTKELRLRGISTLEAANDYLAEFIVEYNHRFQVKPKNQTNMHRSLSSIEINKLKDILILKTSRIVSKNLTIHYKNLEYQIKTDRPSYALRKASIEVWEDNQNNVVLVYQGKRLSYTIFKAQEKAEIVDSKRLNQVVDIMKKHTYQSYFDKLTEQTWDNYLQS